MNPPTVSAADRAAIEAACTRVIVDYCHSIDSFDDARMVQLFAQDGEWVRPGQAPLCGKGQIAAYMAGRDRSITMRHMTSNIRIDVQDATHAVGRTYWTLYRQSSSTPVAQALTPFSVGEYHDAFVLEDGQWCFQRREIRFALHP